MTVGAFEDLLVETWIIERFTQNNHLSLGLIVASAHDSCHPKQNNQLIIWMLSLSVPHA